MKDNMKPDNQQISIEFSHYMLDVHFIAYAKTFGVYDGKKGAGMRVDFKHPISIDTEREIEGFKYTFPEKEREMLIHNILYGINANIEFIYNGNGKIPCSSLTIQQKNTILRMIMERTAKWKLYKKMHPETLKEDPTNLF